MTTFPSIEKDFCALPSRQNEKRKTAKLNRCLMNEFLIIEMVNLITEL